MAVPERKGRSAAWLSAGVVVALLAVAAVVAGVVCLDGRHRQQLAELEGRLDTLAHLVDELQRQLDLHVNNSVHGKGSLSSEPQKEIIYEDEYEYDDEEGSYEYDDEEGEEGSHKTTVKRTTVLSKNNSSDMEVVRRSRRDISAVREESQPDTLGDSDRHKHEIKSNHHQPHPSSHQPNTPVYQEQRRPDESYVRLRHGGRIRSGHKADVELLSGTSREELEPQNHQCDILAAHYVADASSYNVRDHSHYYGNNVLFHPYGIFKDWKPANWMFDLGFNSLFTIHHGKLSVQKPGIYFVYAQIYYAASHDRCGFHIKHNGEEVAQCMVTSYGRTAKRNTCFTAVVLQLQTSDLLWTSEVEGHRNTSFKSSHSFFGLILLKQA